ncbi:MAG: LysR substrate-binding domain-containing protein [Acidimicrobiaceae bacterium]|nr:LysR substrate-binding domain-containing protein [Acidimicrobiaceae bacterium]MXY02204.1 LysR family transcriptional regulator [Acidimicrobiales bacterium]MXZ14448.1 LysR family transcriptional regulator [Acidimicrobiales bacterium]MYG89629.1 LysR family transcriptional regulator [Acidimicrobiales bacterium]MYI28461.1 LysR family transcriptional regulator [Acidimicrobiales bacterium]
MNLQRLRYFATVAEELHFGRAAQRLHMSQPPLSQQIRQLERELDTALFDRSTRRVSLTDAGKFLYPEAVRLLAAADGVDRLMEQHRHGQTGTLRVGFVDSAAYEVMPRVLAEYRRRRPQVEFELHTLSSDEQVQALRAGRIDLGIGRAAADAGGVEATLVMHERLVLAAGASHRLAASGAACLGDLAGEPIIGFDRNVSPSLHAVLAGMLRVEGVAYDPMIEATEYTTILGFVAAGEGVAIVPAGVQTFRPPGLQYTPLTDASASVPLLLLRGAGEPLPLVSHALEAVAELYDSRDPV